MISEIQTGIQTNELWANNPYSNGSVFIFNEGDVQLTRTPLIYIKSPNDKPYTIKEGDDLWSISYAKYGESKWYWVLQEVNQYLFIGDIQIGDNIVIPDLDYLFANQPTATQ